MPYILVLTTCPNSKIAQRIAASLVRERLAACVQLIPKVKSYYRWKGKVESAHEHQLWIKTSSKNYARLKKEILRIHPYEVPEILSISISQGLKTYLKWMDQETRH